MKAICYLSIIFLMACAKMPSASRHVTQSGLRQLDTYNVKEPKLMNLVLEVGSYRLGTEQNFAWWNIKLTSSAPMKILAPSDVFRLDPADSVKNIDSGAVQLVSTTGSSRDQVILSAQHGSKMKLEGTVRDASGFKRTLSYDLEVIGGKYGTYVRFNNGGGKAIVLRTFLTDDEDPN